MTTTNPVNDPATPDAVLRERVAQALDTVAHRRGIGRLRGARDPMADAALHVLKREWEGLRIDNDRLQAELATYKEALHDTLMVDTEIRDVIYRKLGLPPASSVADLEQALEKLAAAALPDPDGPEVHIRIGGLRAEVRQLREQLAEARASREAWAIEAMGLDAELASRPTTDAYDKACDALELRRIALVEALGLPPTTSFYDAVDRAASRPAIPADWERQLHNAIRDDNDGGGLYGDLEDRVMAVVQRWRRTPVSGSDTTTED